MSSLVVPPTAIHRRRSLLTPAKTAVTRRLSGSVLARKADGGAAAASATSATGGRYKH